MNNEDVDFLTLLQRAMDEDRKAPNRAPWSNPSPPPPPKPSVELTVNQKKVAIGYILGDVSKGLFEDCEDFWEGMSQEQIDDEYGSYRQAVEEYVESLKLKLLGELDEGSIK